MYILIEKAKIKCDRYFSPFACAKSKHVERVC